MSIHRVSISAILFRNGTTRTERRKKARKLRKNGALPGLRELQRNRKKENKRPNGNKLSWIFRKAKGDL